tara:strand:- start:725 stop:1990 length:1266 start_codon:yes stop_codon:yes gene_type:complete
MIDIKQIRDNQDKIQDNLRKKDSTINLKDLVKADIDLRELTKKLNDLQSQQNQQSKEIGILKAKGESADNIFSELKKLSETIKELESDQREKSDSLKAKLLELPNIPHDSVPIGVSEKDNIIHKDCVPNDDSSFNLKSHVEIAEKLDLLDFEAGAKISGSGFPLYKGKGALLERALLNFMIDFHLKNYNYTEFFTPFMVKPSSALTVGQLPKFEEDMYFVEKDELFLIPTAEVPLTNIHKDEILELNQIPKYYLANSACFRREAGSYGKDTRGLLRVHQFNKVELVKFVHPDSSYNELELLTKQASKLLDLLELDYRVIELCSGDLSFSAAKCYDLEVWAPGEKKWLEVSSCSNFEDFQARRGNIRFRNENNKVDYLHTLNGSGLATPRIFAALLETHQNKDGSISVPLALQPYIGLSEIK